MPARRRSPAELARDRLRIEDLYFSGWLQVDIGKELGLDQSTISRDLKWLHEDWLKRAADDVAKHKAKELARIDRLEREYWRAWERTLEEKTVTSTEKTREVGGTDRDKASLRREQLLGDARFLSGIQWCIQQRCKILGVEAPTEIKHSGGVQIAASDADLISAAKEVIAITESDASPADQ